MLCNRCQGVRVILKDAVLEMSAYQAEQVLLCKSCGVKKVMLTDVLEVS